MNEKAALANAQQPAYAPDAAPPPPTYDASMQSAPPPAAGYPQPYPGQPAYAGQPPPQMAGYSGQPPPMAPGYVAQMPQMAPGYTPVPMNTGPAYYTPQPGVPPTGKAGQVAPVPQGNVMHVVQPQVVQTVILNNRLGRHPVSTVCPRCGASVITNTTKIDGSMAWLWCFIIFILGGGIFCLCLIPFCVDSFKDVRHTCPNCKSVLGTHSSMS